ncbi:MAG: YHYH protein [Alphaproteobacteria bacterium]
MRARGLRALIVAGAAMLISGGLLAQSSVLAELKARIAAATDARDLTAAVLTNRSADCADPVTIATGRAADIQRGLTFAGAVVITADEESCRLLSNNIPNHDFNDASARFAHGVQEVGHSFTIPRRPVAAARPTALTHRSYDAVMLNGVPLDILSAGCYRPNERGADRDGNVAIGCQADSRWLLDPVGVSHRFGADRHNAHTQPDGSYHYHGNPMALFDDHPPAEGSPVIGFAADGFPVYGSWFRDEAGALRKAVSGYELRKGERPSSARDPGGFYDGMYVDDYEFTGRGDLDPCNGMTVNGQYGYYVTDAYPWVLRCLAGTAHPSFAKLR